MPLSQEDYDSLLKQLQGLQANHWNTSLMPKTGNMSDMLQAIPLALMGMGGPKMPAGAMKSGPDAILPPRTAQSPEWNIPTGTELFNKIRNSGLEVPANSNPHPLEESAKYYDALDRQQGKPPVNITPASPQDFINALAKSPQGKFKATPDHPAQYNPPGEFLYRAPNRFEANAEVDTPLAKLYTELFKHANKNE